MSSFYFSLEEYAFSGNSFEVKGLPTKDKEFKKADLSPEKSRQGFAVKASKCLKNIIKNCKTCRKCVLSTKETDKNAYIRAKEYYSDKNLLCYPSAQISECFLDIQNICVSHLKKNVPKTGLKRSIKIHVEMFAGFPFKCETHMETLKQYFIDVSSNIIIYSWCRSVNRIIAGKIAYDGDDEVKLCAQHYFIKHRHYKNNK